ncbi:MAG: aminotransferase class I/II-fold pyridoxal phosphate-dependent enzyme [Ignavibacteriaceae bacterium]|nr:aminotransferase class I/II-fold pyridoxal phosphate-dependent enzyme [Ignavibacteriaceae bacterium]
MIDSKLPDIGISIFAVMSKMANDSRAINLSQGFPDFNCSDELIELFHRYQKEGFNQYAPYPGVMVLRENISKKTQMLYGKYYNPETEITVTAGATQALYTAITILIKKNDEAILLEPAYDSYAPAVIASGGRPISVPLDFPNYNINWNKVKDAISSKTKLIIINSPHNPTGSVISRTDIKVLEELLRDKDIFVISDEVYEHIVFDGQKHISLCTSEELSKKSFIISSFGKTFHATGWKVGYCVAPESLMYEFRKLHQFMLFSVNTPAQYAYAEYLNNPENYLYLNSFYQKKRDLFLNELKNSNFIFTPAEGTYFQLLDYSRITQITDMEFSEYLTKKVGVAVIPISPFMKTSKHQIIRTCFAKKDDVLLQAAEKLKDVREIR